MDGTKGHSIPESTLLYSLLLFDHVKATSEHFVCPAQRNASARLT
jgi:hypothetical protein